MEEMDENDSQRNEKRHNDAQTEERRKQQTMASMGGSPAFWLTEESHYKRSWVRNPTLDTGWTISA